MRKLTKNLGDVITHAMSAVENADLDYNHQSMSLSSWFSHGKTWYPLSKFIDEPRENGISPKWMMTKVDLCYFAIWATA